MRFATSLVTLAAVGCASMDSADLPPPPFPGMILSEVVTTNGRELNGIELNGTGLASTLVAVRLAGAQLNDAPLANLWLEGGELRGQHGSVTLAGADLVGLVLLGVRGDGSPVELRIGSAADAGGGVWRYEFLYREADDAWTTVCAQGASVVVSGRWNYQQGVPGGGAFTPDPSVFTVGCPSSAVEKCVVLGYRPWTQFGAVSGVGLHSSCVRAIRADYCGDGRSHTTNGRVINIYDGVGVQADTESWPIEAEWLPTGTRCVSAVARDALGITCSSVIGALSCGDPSHFQSGTRVMTETLGPIH
jgi:hypothetical protein